MKAHTLTHTNADGWSAPFPACDGPSTMVLAFASGDPIGLQAQFDTLAAQYPTSMIVGCSTAGEICGRDVYDNSVSVGIVEFEHTELRTASAKISDSADSRAAGVEIGTALAATDLVGVIVLSEGLEINGSELAAGLSSVVGTSVISAGGLAADGDRFEETWVLHEGRPTPGVVAAVGLYGDRVDIKCGHRGGWDIFGPQRRVTRSSGNVVHEIDGIPALDLYKRYLGDLAADLPSSGLLFPLAVWTDDPTQQVVRTLLSIDDADRTLTFAGDVEEGSWAQLMQADFNRLIGGAVAAVEQAMAGDDPVFCLAVSCVGRRLVMGARVGYEAESTLEALPPGSSQVGFYSYGELSPDGLGSCDLHNQTMTVTLLSER